MDTDGRKISEERAAEVWHRAARLQAEAATRLEERSKMLAGRGEAAPGETGFHVEDVKAAAAEAGIAPEFVELALAEVEGGAPAGPELTGWSARAAERVLGADGRALEVSRAIACAPAAVMGAMRLILPAHPYTLALRDHIGGDPLDGGVLVFDIPPYTMGGNLGSFAYHAAAVDVKQLRFSLRPLGGASPACEVTVTAEMRHGVRRNWKVARASTGTVGVGGGLLAAGLFANAPALGALGLLGLGPGAVVGVALGGAALWGYGKLYRYSLRKLHEELQRLLGTIDATARTGNAFAPPAAPRPAMDDGTGAIIVTTIT